MLRKLLLALLLLSLSALGANFPNVSNTDLVNPVPQGVVPLFSVSSRSLPEDSIDIGYTIVNTTFEDSFETDSSDKLTAVSPLLVLGEVLGFNGLIWAWDRYVLDKDYARTGPSYWKRNLKEGWEWDHNHWAINFYGHPYQGSVYYNIARGSGYGFYASLMFAALGSYTWEMFAETEYPSTNDLITTSIGGAVYGEVLYRLSRKFYGTDESSWYKQVGAFGLAHSAYLQRKVFGNRDDVTGNTPMKLSVFLGAGSHFGNIYRFGGRNEDDLDQRWDDKHFMYGGEIEYGKPFRKVNRPFDYFTLFTRGEVGPDGTLFQLDVTGKLTNVGVHGRGHWVDFATYLDYCTFYGDFATVGTISVGTGIDFSLWLLPTLRFRMYHQIYFILLGTTDMGYDDLIQAVHPEYASDMDNYQYNMGAKYVLGMELMVGKKIRLKNKTIVDALHTIPGSLPHYGADGWDMLLMNHTSMEYDLTKKFSLGGRLDVYAKIAAYSSEFFEPMSRGVFAYTLYFSYKLF